MNINPILKREIMVQSRSLRLPMLVSGINLLLFMTALLGMFGILSRMQLLAEREYGSFLALYGTVVFLAFILLLFVTPSLTAGSISMERSMETLDLMLTTQMSPLRIMTGKLSASAFSVCILLCSCVPVMLLPLVYGGISFPEVAALFLVFALEALVLLCIGLFASSLSRNTVRATAGAYGITAALCIGFPVLSLLLSPFFRTGGNYFACLLLLNPAACVGSMVAEQTGYGELLPEIFRRMSFVPGSALVRFFVPVSLLSQLALAFILLLLSVVNITPKRGRGRRERKS